MICELQAKINQLKYLQKQQQQQWQKKMLKFMANANKKSTNFNNSCNRDWCISDANSPLATHSVRFILYYFIWRADSRLSIVKMKF